MGNPQGSDKPYHDPARVGERRRSSDGSEEPTRVERRQENMPEENKEADAQPLTATDARLDELSKQMADMKSTYEAQLAEYQKANKELYEMIHAPKADTYTVEPEQVGFDTTKATKAFLDTIGLKE